MKNTGIPLDCFRKYRKYILECKQYFGGKNFWKSLHRFFESKANKMPRSFLIRKILGLDDDDNNIAVGVKETSEPMNDLLTNDIVANVLPRGW